MSDKLPFAVSLLTQDALIEGIINKDDSDLFFYYVRNMPSLRVLKGSSSILPG